MCVRKGPGTAQLADQKIVLMLQSTMQQQRLSSLPVDRLTTLHES